MRIQFTIAPTLFEIFASDKWGRDQVRQILDQKRIPYLEVPTTMDAPAFKFQTLENYNQALELIKQHKAGPAITVLYDGACPLCQREIAMYKNLIPTARDVRVIFEDVNDPTMIMPQGMTREQLLARFHVRGLDNKLISGARAFIALWSVLPGWRWLAKTSRVPGVTWFMEIMYRMFLGIRPVIQRLFRPRPQTGYVSDVTEFINELKRKDPELEDKQLYGRNLLWNRPQDLDTNKELTSGKQAQTAYVYYDKFSKDTEFNKLTKSQPQYK